VAGLQHVVVTWWCCGFFTMAYCSRFLYYRMLNKNDEKGW